MDKDLKPVKAQRMRGCVVLALDGHLYLPTSSQGSGNNKEEGQKDQKNQKWKSNRVGAHMNSQLLGQPTQDLCKMKPDTNPVGSGKVAVKSHPY